MRGSRGLVGLSVALVVAIGGLSLPAYADDPVPTPTPTPTTPPTETPPPPVVTLPPAPLPTVVRRVVIGHSVKKREIIAYRLGEPTASKKVVLFAGIHGNERGAPKTLWALRDGKPIKGIDLWIIPVLNPDGYAKNKRRNSHGVDLNRNFSTGFKKGKGGGSKPFSQPETRALRTFLGHVQPDHVVALHQPLRGVDVRKNRDPRWASYLTALLGLPKSKLDCGSKCHGTFSMWFTKHHRGAVLTVELSRKPSKKYLAVTAPNAYLRSFGAWR